MALNLLPKSIFETIDFLHDVSTPVPLFTRHSLRELVDGQGLAGYDLQLAEPGRGLAYACGEFLSQQGHRAIKRCISCPIQRWVDTA
ncbi:histidine phosphatase family protein, partial [Acinetobacter courvalinii]